MSQSRRQIIESIYDAVARHAASQPNGDSDFSNESEINDEELALLCAGELDQLDKPSRQRLLKQVAATPWARELVARHADLKKKPREVDAVGFTIMRIVPWAWAAAAVVLIALSCLTMLQPPHHSEAIYYSPLTSPNPSNPAPGPTPKTNPYTNVNNSTKPPGSGNFVNTLPGTAPSASPAKTPGASPPHEPASRLAKGVVISAIIFALLSIPGIYYVRMTRRVRWPR